MKLRPLHDYVLVRRAEAAHLSAGGIAIPDTSAEKPQQGTVVTVGQGAVLKDGRTRPVAVKPGERILFGKSAGTEVTVDHETLLMMRESEIIAILEE